MLAKGHRQWAQSAAVLDAVLLEVGLKGDGGAGTGMRVAIVRRLAVRPTALTLALDITLTAPATATREGDTENTRHVAR